MQISRWWRWTLGIGLFAMIVLAPAVHYRQTYRYGKRLRVVREGELYRSGCLTADGLREAIQKYKIKTVINLQDEAPDPDLLNHYFTFKTTPESEVCRSLGAKMVFLNVELVDAREAKTKKPATIDGFLEVMDNRANFPVLLHCKAGLHRTGCLASVYRQEYEGWTKEDALRELKNHGFGEFFSTTANPYIVQYVLGYRTRKMETQLRGVPARTAGRGSAGQVHGASYKPLPTAPRVESVTP